MGLNGQAAKDQDAAREPASRSQSANSQRGAASSKTAQQQQQQQQSLKRVCYFHMEPAATTPQLELEQVDGRLCTHVILAFAHINSQARLVVVRDSDTRQLEQVREFKRRHPHVRVLVSVANSEEHQGFGVLAQAGNELRHQFAKSAVEFLAKYHLDGLDLHWQFPNFPAGLPAFLNPRGELERSGLTKILKALRSAVVENFFDRQLAEQHEMARVARTARSYNTTTRDVASHVEPHLLTVAIGGQETLLRSSYELKQLANLCDWFNVMSFDYFLFKAYSPFTGPMSPLHPIVDPFVPYLSRLSLAWTVQRLLDEGLEREKLVMGVPCYARAYKLIFHNTAPAPFTLAVGVRGGQQGDYLSYREVLEIMGREDTIVEFDEKARVPYLLTDGGYTWVSYESPKSVREKVRYILDNRLGGYMTCSLNSDDFLGRDSAMDAQSNGSATQAKDTVQISDYPLHRAMLDEALTYEPA